ncbi:TonB-dependent receptor [Flavobacterium luminosum]|uniref:TonB-dependent receptor n=1 Tax=Flavobacterium luminosum TaxID=2949086 RepID=A0ABT0TPZ5_9FLAO|nr:TonB-dependent receptor [Flavobacterium sp. HXWNR70]MCL9809567.1 TonB-dependent receptor [Flavobacterium sp. HXWNR70]
MSSNLKSDLFITDLENNNRCHFMDLELKYKATDKMNFFLLGNNLLNEKYYQQKSNTDYSAYISQTNVTPRYFLLTMEYNF